MVNNSRSQGFAHAFLVIGLVVALLGALGFIFWQNFIHKEPTVTNNKTVPKTQPKEEVDLNKGYLVLEDWGIKFKLPDSGSEVRSYKLPVKPNDMGFTEIYEFTTKRVEELGGRCAKATSDGSAIRLALLQRTPQYLDEVTGTIRLNDGQPINGYYYFLTGAQSVCSDGNDEVSGQIQIEDRKLVTDLLLHPVVYTK